MLASIVLADSGSDAAVYVLVGIVVAIIVVALLLFRAMWKVPEPNQALLVSGRHHKQAVGEGDFGFRIVVGSGVLVVPGIQVVRRLNLDLKEAELQVECVTEQGIPVGIRGVVIFKVRPRLASRPSSSRPRPTRSG